MCAVRDDQCVEVDREPDQDKTRCDWSPRREDKWFCACGHEWNTFETGGLPCPALTNGLRPSASRAASGQRIPIGMRSDLSDDDPDMPVRSPAWKQSTN
jgi:hypothetical protein